jgi:hypothetical protein
MVQMRGRSILYQPPARDEAMSDWIDELTNRGMRSSEPQQRDVAFSPRDDAVAQLIGAVREIQRMAVTRFAFNDPLVSEICALSGPLHERLKRELTNEQIFDVYSRHR